MRKTLPSVLVALLIAVLPVAAAAGGGTPPDTLGLQTPWHIVPPSPCVNDSVFMIVRGFVATPCDSFLGAEAVTPLHVRIRTQVYDDRACFAPPYIFYPVPVALGRFAAGPQAIDVEVETVHVRPDGSTFKESRHFRSDFVIAPECPTPAPPPTDPLPYVDAIFTEPPRPCAGRPTALVLAGHFLDGCGQVVDAHVISPENVELTIKVATLSDTMCTLGLKPWRQAFDLGTLPSGPHRTNITLHVIGREDSAGNAFRRSTHHGIHEFFVYGDCEPIPPAPGPLPHVRDIMVGPGPACPNDSIVVQVVGEFPSDCFQFRRIVLVPSLIVGPGPEPPIVRIIIDDGGCLGRPCANVAVPWRASVKLPPLPPRSYNLMVELAQVSCSDTFPPGQLFRTLESFAVRDSCAPCLFAFFGHPAGNFTACNATVSPEKPAELILNLAPHVDLAGLQGAFRLQPPGLRIARLEAIGGAAGMLLQWTQTPDGARFLLFAERGAPIPGIPPTAPAFSPVLRVILEAVPGSPLPDYTRVQALDLLGSDIEGRAVPLCMPVPIYPLGGPPGVIGDPSLGPTALVCAVHGCDLNADGLEDIRDLVVMVHCISGEGACPDTAGGRFDCDGDGVLALADVFCCARHILARFLCPGCPWEGHQQRFEPTVGIDLGAPAATAAGVEVPITVRGGDRLGGALLGLSFPADRYDLDAFEVGDGRNGWLTLQEVRDGRLVVGFIAAGMLVEGTAGGSGGARTLEGTIRLTLKPGQVPGGAIALVDGNFSGPDGVMLAVPALSLEPRPLPGAPRLALSGNRPNPFSAETRFTLALASAADVEVGIYDLRGRRVAHVFRGRLEAGPKEFIWNGRGSDGSPASEGIYFYRVAASGKTLARKLILMRGN